MLASMETEAASVGLRFNPAKCAILHVGAGNGDRVLPTSFQIQRKMINPLAQGKSYTHLGIPTGFSVDAQTPYAAVSDLHAIDRSHLAPGRRKKRWESSSYSDWTFCFGRARVQGFPHGHGPQHP